MKQEDAMILPGDTASGAQGPGSPSWEEDHAPADKDLSPGANEGREGISKASNLPLLARCHITIHLPTFCNKYIF